MYHIAICDDDEIFIKYIKRLFYNCGIYENDIIFYEYLSGEELVKQMKNNLQCDLLILDMQMNGMDGNAAAKAFREQFPHSMLVFCSGVCMPAVESFETMPFRYLLKEYTEKRMQKELDIIIQELKASKIPPYIEGKWYNNTIKLHIDDILYIEIYKKGSYLHCYINNEVKLYRSSKKVSDFYEELKDFGFAYAHNSYIVNMKHIAEANIEEMIFFNGDKLSISRSKAKEFRTLFAQQLAKKY